MFYIEVALFNYFFMQALTNTWVIFTCYVSCDGLTFANGNTVLRMCPELRSFYCAKKKTREPCKTTIYYEYTGLLFHCNKHEFRSSRTAVPPSCGGAMLFDISAIVHYLSAPPPSPPLHPLCRVNTHTRARTHLL